MTVSEKMERLAKKRQEMWKSSVDNMNSRPCFACGGKILVQKFRNVVGEISGDMHGSFSLFGGSVSGFINGYTKTLPVLSCKKCGNERKIETWKHVSGREVFWDFMRDFYFGVDDNNDARLKKIDPFFLERPIETRQYMLDNENDYYVFYNEIPHWSTETWAKAGFKIDKVIKKKSFLWKKWEEEACPTWEELR